MRKLVLLLTLCLSLGGFLRAGEEISQMFSLTHEKDVVKTLKQEEKATVKSFQERSSFVSMREERISVLKEQMASGLKEENATKSGRQDVRACAKSRKSMERLDSIVSLDSNGNFYSGQFLAYNKDYTELDMKNCMWDAAAKSWKPVQEFSYKWDKEDRILFEQMIVYYEWGTEGEKKEYTYNERGLLTTYINSGYNPYDGWFYLQKITYAYDNAGNPKELIGYFSDGMGGWEPSAKEIVEYDELGRQIVFEEYGYNGVAWEGSVREEYEYDVYGNLSLQKIALWGWEKQNWQYDMKYEYGYDENGNILLHLIGFWNPIAQDWSGYYGITEKTVFAYDNQNREVSQIFSQLVNDVWVQEAAMYTSWTSLGDGKTQSIREAYDEKILAGGRPWQILTKRYNHFGKIIYEKEVYKGVLLFEEICTYDERGNETEVLTLDYEQDFYINTKTTFDKNDNPIYFVSYFGASASGPWSKASEFDYEYQNNYRTRAYAYYYLIPQDNWGWGVDLDFNVPVTELIQLAGARIFENRVYDHKITKTYQYFHTGSSWGAYPYTRYYSNQKLPDETVNNLTISFDTDCNATLAWEAPKDVEGNILYKVYRDGVLVSADGFANTSFKDSPSGIIFENTEWCVVYVVAGEESRAACVAGSCVPPHYINVAVGENGTAALADGSVVFSENSEGRAAVEHGTNATVVFNPNFGYAIESVTVDNIPNQAAVETGRYTFANVAADHSLTVHFKPSEYTITALAGLGGVITPSGITEAAYGDVKTFAIIPDAGYYITQVLVDGVNNAAAVSAGTYTLTVMANHTIEAFFEIYTYTVASSAGVGGTISPNGNRTVSYGSSPVYTFVPNWGYEISKVLVDGTNNTTAVSTGTYTFSNVTKAHTISVEFQLKSYTVTASAGAGGSISPKGAQTVAHNSTPAFTITPDAGYEIAGVLVDGASVGKQTGYTFNNVIENHSISVEFRLKSYPIIATAGSGGSISPEGTATVSHGSSHTCTITPDAGYEIAEVMVDGVSVGALSTYTFSNVVEGHVIAATFKTTVGINDLDADLLTVYPNPVVDYLNIESPVAIQNIRVFDMTGRMTFERSGINSAKTTINVSAFANGIYFIQVDGKVVKVIKR